MTNTRRLLALVLSVPMVTVFLGAPAHAAPTLLTCPMALTATIAPGLTLTSSTQQIGGTMSLGTVVSPLTPCSSPTGVRFAGGTGKITGSGQNLACLLVPVGGMTGSANGTVNLTWYDRGTHVAGHSIASWNASVSGLVPVVSARIISGHLNGTNIVAQPVLTGLSGNCGILGSPVVSASFAGPAEFVGL